MMEEVLQEVLKLSAAVYEDTQHVAVAGGDCDKLGKGIRAVSEFLNETRTSLLGLPRQKVEPALQVLLDALSAAQEVLLEFRLCSCLCAVVYAGELKGQLQNVGMMLGAALGMLPAAQLCPSCKEQEQLEKLSKQLQNSKYTMLGALQRLCSRLEYLMQYDEQKLSQLVMHILAMPAKSQGLSEQQCMESEVQELKSHLLQGKEHDRQKLQYIHCFLALLNMRQQVLPGTETQPHYQLLDPISLQLMQDPVLMVESGITYNRATLVDWLGKKGLQAFLTGELVDVLTGRLLTKCPPDLVPNVEVRKAVERWQLHNSTVVDSGSLGSWCSRSDASQSLASAPSTHTQQAAQEQGTDSEQHAEPELVALAELLAEKFSISLPRDSLSKLAVALRGDQVSDSVADLYARLIEVVEAAQALFTSAGWHGSRTLEVDVAYEVFKECGFHHISFVHFKELCLLQFKDARVDCLNVEQLLMLISNSLSDLQQNFQRMSGGADVIDAAQLQHALVANHGLSRLPLADAQQMTRFHNNNRDDTLRFTELWELHNCVVSLLTAFRNEDRAGTGYVKEDQALRALLHSGMGNVTSPILRDAWRKVAPRQMQLSCSSLLALVYHLLINDAHAHHHVRIFHGIGKVKTGFDEATSTFNEPWAFWESLTPGKMLHRRYEVCAMGSLGPVSGTCLAYDCRTCMHVHIRFFFEDRALAEELEAMQHMQPTHVVEVIETWEATEDEGAPLPAALVSQKCATLEAWLEQQSMKPSPLSERKELLSQVLEALCDLEQARRVHLALSPANIVYSWDSEICEHRWKLMGLCDSCPLGQAARVGTPLGYTAPELVEFCGSRELMNVDSCAPHIWSLGVIAFQVLTGSQLYKDSVSSPWVLKGLNQQLLPTHVHRNHLLHILGATELSLLESLLLVNPYRRKAAHALLQEFFPQRLPPPDMELVDCSPRPVPRGPHSIPVTRTRAAGAFSMFRNWQSAAQWALQPSPTIRQQMKQSQEQMKAYTAEIAFNASGMVPFPWPTKPLHRSSSSLLSPKKPATPQPGAPTAATAPQPLAVAQPSTPKDRSGVEVAGLVFRADQLWSAVLRTPFSKPAAASNITVGTGASSVKAASDVALVGSAPSPNNAKNTGKIAAFFCNPVSVKSAALHFEGQDAKSSSQGDVSIAPAKGPAPGQLASEKAAHIEGIASGKGSDVSGPWDQDHTLVKF